MSGRTVKASVQSRGSVAGKALKARRGSKATMQGKTGKATTTSVK